MHHEFFYPTVICHIDNELTGNYDDLSFKNELVNRSVSLNIFIPYD
jgi:hypothetical protein